MSQKKSNLIKKNQDKAILDKFLWLIENYLPQKKKRSPHLDFQLDKLESLTINKLKKLASSRSKSLGENLNNTKITFTIGPWALPYLNLLKRIKLIK